MVAVYCQKARPGLPPELSDMCGKHSGVSVPAAGFGVRVRKVFGNVAKFPRHSTAADAKLPEYRATDTVAPSAHTTGQQMLPDVLPVYSSAPLPSDFERLRGVCQRAVACEKGVPLDPRGRGCLLSTVAVHQAFQIMQKGVVAENRDEQTRPKLPTTLMRLFYYVYSTYTLLHNYVTIHAFVFPVSMGMNILLHRAVSKVVHIK